MAVDQPRAVVLQSLMLREAAGWIEKLDTPEPSEEAFAQWLQWLGASDAHRRAYWRMFELWYVAGDLTANVERDT